MCVCFRERERVVRKEERLQYMYILNSARCVVCVLYSKEDIKRD